MVYGFSIDQLKTYDEIPDELTDKAYGDYPGGRDVMEVLWNEYDAFSHNSVDAVGGAGGVVAGVEVAYLSEIGTEEVSKKDLEQAKEKLTDELEEKIRQVAKIDEDEEPSFVLASTIG